MVAMMGMEGWGGTAPLLLFSGLLFLQITLRFLPSPGSPKKFTSTQEAELVRQIKQLNREADALNTPATFAKSSKLRRAAVAKKKELAALEQPGGIAAYNWLATKLPLSLVIKVIVILGLGGWLRQMHVASVPASLLRPFGGMLTVRGDDSDMVNVSFTVHECFVDRIGQISHLVTGKSIEVSVMPWMVLSTTVANYLVNNIWRRT